MQIRLGLDHESNIVAIEDMDINHILVAGGSRQGKSVLCKCIIHQLMKNGGYAIFIVDGKDGMDFGKKYEEHCKMSFTLDDTNRLLDYLLLEYKNRATFLRKNECANINDYNSLNQGNIIQKICLYIDEIIDILDTKGKSKENKIKITQINGKISELARKGSAVGIMMILATQKPDADILNTQIKSNCGTRMCTYVNDIETSRQVLSSTIASKIEAVRGRFAMVHLSKEFVFQGYDFNPNDIQFVSYGFHQMINFDEFYSNFPSSNKYDYSLNSEEIQKNDIPEEKKEIGFNYNKCNLLELTSSKGVDKMEIKIYINCMIETIKNNNEIIGYKQICLKTGIKENSGRKIFDILKKNNAILKNPNKGNSYIILNKNIVVK